MHNYLLGFAQCPSRCSSCISILKLKEVRWPEIPENERNTLKHLALGRPCPPTPGQRIYDGSGQEY
ncbi:hypothetical protein C8T65DRAFT_656686 [Cerioporus squamosus]|nr:hypothetical protein C8T65DRAFT_656643 [Cerioporus squamosus]KAI0701277.1 hypothetical protein C8T65DRAFT_656665 [Cerioporus squamosus]KAI0701281.1 hypothetical protein C8T65DRAFT_656686 [Cerioporus squamosus]